MQFSKTSKKAFKFCDK